MRNLLIASVLCVGGVIGTVIASMIAAEAEASKDWPSVAGEVSGTYVKRQGGGRRRSTSWSAIIEYTYEVDGESHSGDRWTASGGRKARSESHAEDIIAKYPIGRGVSVHYDPKDPSTSVLQAGSTGNEQRHVWFGALIALAGGIWLAVLLVQRRKAAATPPSEGAA